MQTESSIQTKQFLNVPFELKGDVTSDDEYFYFEGYASVFGNVDLGNDVIEKGAFSESLNANKDLPILWGHKMGEPPIGNSIHIEEDNYGLFIKARLPKNDTFVAGRIIPQIKTGSIKEMSIGYFTVDSKMEGEVRRLTKIALFETSLVTKAMNPKARLTRYKAFAPSKNLPFAARDRAWDSSTAEKRIRSFTDSDDKPSSDYRKYFMHYDAANEENFGAYKLLFCDVVNDEVMIVPRAVFAIAAVLSGARGGVDLPSSDRSKIISFVNSLYEKMAKEFDDSSIVSPLAGKSELIIESIRNVEEILCDGGFSQKEAKTIISKVKEFSSQRDAEEKQAQRDVENKISASDVESVKSEIVQILNKLKS